ncbi:MAG: hypothetical protein ACRC3H_24605 [Lachnospiraceae bacterium]
MHFQFLEFVNQYWNTVKADTITGIGCFDTKADSKMGFACAWISTIFCPLGIKSSRFSLGNAILSSLGGLSGSKSSRYYL